MTLVLAGVMAVPTVLSAHAQGDFDSWRRPVLRVGLDYTVRPGDAVREVLMVFGDVTVEGRVNRNVVVWFGNARLSSTAAVDGAVVVIGGTGAVAEGAFVGDDFVVIGGRLAAPDSFAPGGEYIVVGPAALGGRLEVIVPWITRGLLWGRPIVPDLPWVWGVAGVFFLVYLAINLVFEEPVRVTAAALGGTPLTSFLVGLLVLLLTGPVCALLTVSVIGIAVVPFVLCALVVAAIIGKVAAARSIGRRAVPQESADSRWQSLRSFAVGSAVITVAYMVPFLGLVVWTLLGVAGLGAAALAFIAGYRQENPAPARRKFRFRERAPVSEAGVPGPAAAAEASFVGPQNHRPPPITEAPERPSNSYGPPVASAPPELESDLASFPRALFRDRLAAFVLDIILILVAQQILDLGGATIRDSAFFLLLLAYHVGFWTWKATTVGGIICQLRVVRVDGAPLSFADALVRGLSSIFSLAVLGIGCFWILRDPERQAWHDKIAGTYVVKVPRHWPL
ncbi:MAG: RDD family protein [Acidobacteria bacterium]|nr:RDD family protein [Acidobacteriota bacterium]